MYECPRCGVFFPRSGFGNDKNQPDGRRRTCRACTVVASRTNRRQRLERLGATETKRQQREAVARWRARNPEKSRIKEAARQAARRSLARRHRDEYLDLFHQEIAARERAG